MAVNSRFLLNEKHKQTKQRFLAVSSLCSEGGFLYVHSNVTSYWEVSILLYKLKPSSQYDADLGVMSGASVSGINGLAEDRSQFSVPSICPACIPTLNYLTFDFDPRGKKTSAAI